MTAESEPSASAASSSGYGSSSSYSKANEDSGGGGSGGWGGGWGSGGSGGGGSGGRSGSQRSATPDQGSDQCSAGSQRIFLPQIVNTNCKNEKALEFSHGNYLIRRPTIPSNLYVANVSEISEPLSPNNTSEHIVGLIEEVVESTKPGQQE